MKRWRRTSFNVGLGAFLCAIFVFASVALAHEIYVVPDYVQRAEGGQFRVRVYDNGLDNHISMGFKIRFDPRILEVVAASKYEDFNDGWILDGDGDPGTTDDQYNTPPVEFENTDTNGDGIDGYVMMFGGRMSGLTGDRLLGWIDFRVIENDQWVNGNTNLDIEVYKDNPNPNETFDSFVKLVNNSGVKDEPTNIPSTSLGVVYVGDNACEGDLTLDGMVNLGDVGELKKDFRRADCHDPGVYCPGDINNDGMVNLGDVGILKQDFRRSDCNTP
jgi:hypothetical protein